ncbi:Uncharacterised protein [Klebsiella pneumoniae]|nr:Uncharacterised protein [Klebsiella pneumoniae]
MVAKLRGMQKRMLIKSYHLEILNNMNLVLSNKFATSW